MTRLLFLAPAVVAGLLVGKSKQPANVLPEVGEVLKSPSSTIDKIGKQMADLSSHMKGIQADEEKRVASAKSVFEQKLLKAKQTTVGMQEKNKELVKENEELVTENATLLSKAQKVLSETENLRGVLADLKGRVTSSEEFLDKAATESDFHAAPELKVVFVAASNANGADDDASDSSSSAETTSSTSAAASATKEESAPAKPAEENMHMTVPSKDVATKKAPVAAAATKEEPKAKAAAAPVVAAQAATKDSDKSKSAQQKKAEAANLAAAKQSNGTDESASDADSEDSDDADDDEVSFVQTSMKTKEAADDMDAPAWLKGKGDVLQSDDDVLQNTSDAAGANNMIKVLQTELDTLKSQEKASLASLATMFKKKFNHSKQQQAKLMKAQEKLKEDQKGLQAHKKDLENAVAFIESSKQHLTENLNELGNYLRDLAHIALAPPSESEKVLPVMTVDITKSAENKKKAVNPDAKKVHKSTHSKKKGHKDVMRALGKH